MKKNICLTVFALLLITKTFAQLSIAPVAGVNISNAYFSGIGNKTSSVLNFHAGILPQYAISEKFSVGLGLQYSNKGYHSDKKTAYEMRFSYLDVMPSAEFRLNSFIAFTAGVNVGLLLDQQMKLGDKWQSSAIGDVDKTDVGAFAGIRLYYNNLFLNAIYNHSLKSISDVTYTDSQGVPIGSGKLWNQNIQIGLGYRFALTK